MGTASYVLVGTDKAMNETFSSTPHGAGRLMSRHEAMKKFEEGIKLSRECQQTLEEAEMKIKILMDGKLKNTDQNLDQ